MSSKAPSRNTDVGGHHLVFYVEDTNAAVAYLKARGITVQEEPTTMQSGPSRGPTWVYFLSPWGMQLELVSYPVGMEVLRAGPGALWCPKD